MKKIFGGAVPKNFFPIEKGLREDTARRAGSYRREPQSPLVDGSYHPVDSSKWRQDRRLLAYKAGCRRLRPSCSSLSACKVTVPDTNTGDIMGDLNKRGDACQHELAEPGWQTIETEIPRAT